MSSARRPIWRRIAWSSFFSFGLLYLLVGVLVFVFTVRHHTNEYHATLSRLSDDLKGEYAECRGDLAEMRRHFATDVEEHGGENVFLLLTSADGRTMLQQSASESVCRQMQENALRPDAHTYRITCSRPKGLKGPVAVRVRRTRLYDGCVLSVGFNVTTDERHTIFVGSTLGASILFALFVGALLGAYLARRITAPLGGIAQTAGRIAGGDYSARVAETDDGSEITELEIAFNKMAQENEKTLSDLRTLTDDIAHDLRTPLTRLRAAAEMQATGGQVRRPLAETVAEETTAMLDLINTMLDISQTDSRINRTPRQDIDMDAFVRGVVDLYSALAEERGITVAVTSPCSPVMLSAHKNKLQQMLGNLLDNALKFTPRGGKISVALQETPLTITVSNTGLGIAAADMPHIFKRFWRADASRSLPGNGLGLALVKAIVTSYGGSISCEATPGSWTRFTIVLPRS